MWRGSDKRIRQLVNRTRDTWEADPLALVVADAAARAVEFVGLPEAQLNLAQAVVHLACAPKSNRVTVALGLAQRDVREAPRGDVPGHLRDAHYRSASTIGHGQGYEYPHDHPDGFVAQEYRPATVAGNRYYEPSDHGHEAIVAERLRRWRDGGTDSAKSPAAGEDPPGQGAKGTEDSSPTD